MATTRTSLTPSPTSCCHLYDTTGSGVVYKNSSHRAANVNLVGFSTCQGHQPHQWRFTKGEAVHLNRAGHLKNSSKTLTVQCWLHSSQPRVHKQYTLSGFPASNGENVNLAFGNVFKVCKLAVVKVKWKKFTVAIVMQYGESTLWQPRIFNKLPPSQQLCWSVPD